METKQSLAARWNSIRGAALPRLLLYVCVAFVGVSLLAVPMCHAQADAHLSRLRTAQDGSKKLRIKVVGAQAKEALSVQVNLSTDGQIIKHAFRKKLRTRGFMFAGNDAAGKYVMITIPKLPHVPIGRRWFVRIKLTPQTTKVDVDFFEAGRINEDGEVEKIPVGIL